jgi:ABC-type taurine transport system substrate-binding protein
MRKMPNTPVYVAAWCRKDALCLYVWPPSSSPL